jgi:predicted RNA-binding Zn ribbon-like protein
MKEFELIGGAPCLDFVNTIHEYGAADPGEELSAYADLVGFVRQTGGISDREASSLIRRAAGKPKEASRMLSTIRDFRAALFKIFSAIILKKDPPDREWKLLNKHFSEMYQHTFLSEKRGEVFLAWDAGKAGLQAVLWPVIRSTAELITSEKRHLMRECMSDTCTWLFLDQSKNQTRRWCDMKKCGNRAKWHRHYDKTKKRR